jgi:predicted small lipoprotein YifL
MIRTLALAAAGLALIVALAACGRQGELERPGPLWGAKAKAEYSAQKRAQAEAASNAAAANQVEPIPDQALQPYANPASTPHDQPVPGAGPSPTGSTQPGGVIPNPFGQPSR